MKKRFKMLVAAMLITSLLNGCSSTEAQSHIRIVEPDFFNCPPDRRHFEGQRYLECYSPAKDTVYFKYGGYALMPDAKNILLGQARWLKTYSGQKVIIEGHADDRSSHHQNYILGQQRAEIVKKYLIKLGVEPDRLKTVSYGDYQAADLKGRTKNRRAVSVTEEAVKSSVNSVHLP